MDTVAEILNLADRSTEKGIMEGLEAEDPDLGGTDSPAHVCVRRHPAGQ